VRQILTDAACKTKPPHTGRLELADLRQAGLVLRITANGARSFAFRFRHPVTRKTLRATIGTYPSTSLEAARERAKVMAEQVEAGINPIEVKQKEREEAPNFTYGALAARYLTEYAERHKRPRSAEEDRRNLAVHILPKWKSHDYRSIGRADAVELIESIISTGRHSAANRVHSLISGVFSFAVEDGKLSVNPVAGLKRRGVEKSEQEETARERTLSDDEIRLFWRGIVRRPVSTGTGLALRLALLTAARANEIAGARKSEFQGLDKPPEAKWSIPGTRTKNRKAHEIPLSSLAIATVKEAIALTRDEDEFLFPTRLARGGALDRHTLTCAMTRFGEGLTGPEAKTWKQDLPTPHDLRRTVTTRLAKLGVVKEVREAVLNHIDGAGIERKHYNRYDYMLEKRAALRSWSDALEFLLTQESVAPLKRAG
jgi:integrase